MYKTRAQKTLGYQDTFKAMLDFHPKYIKSIEQMQNRPNIFGWDSDKELRVLDLCMASGGFTAAVRQKYPKSIVYGLTLPPDDGGHEMYHGIPYSSNIGSSLGQYGPLPPLPPNDKERSWSWVQFHGGPVHVEFLDISLLENEFKRYLHGRIATPSEGLSLRPEAPYRNHYFELVFADGKVPNTERRPDESDAAFADRKKMHYALQLRLIASQLQLGLSRLEDQGTFIILLNVHSAIMFELFNLMLMLRKCCNELHIFKPTHIHTSRSSIYVVAKGVADSQDQKRHQTDEKLLVRKQLLTRWAKIRQWTLSPSADTEPKGDEWSDAYVHKIIHSAEGKEVRELAKDAMHVSLEGTYWQNYIKMRPQPEVPPAAIKAIQEKYGL